MSFDGNPLYAAVLAHPVTLSWLYLYLLDEVLWCLNGASRSVRCDISSASLLCICTYRYLPLVVGCCCRASDCSLHGCCRSNRWLCHGSTRCFHSCSRYCLFSSCSWSAGWVLSHFQLGMHVWLNSIWVIFMNMVLCSSVFSSTNNFDDV